MARLHRKPDADDGFIAGDDRGQHIGPGRADMLRRRQRRRPDRDARMQHRAHMGVVGVEARAVSDIEEGGVLRVEGLRREQDMRCAGTADDADIIARPRAPGHPGAERTDAQKVEQQPAELLPHVRRERAGSKPAAKAASAWVGAWSVAHWAPLSRSRSLPYLA